MKTMTYKPIAGPDIKCACKEAVAMATSKSVAVRFNFNDVELTATPEQTPDELVAEWHMKYNRLCEERRNSPKGRADANRRAKEIATLNEKASDLLASLDSVLASNSQDELMEWLKAFALIADDSAVKFDTAALAEKLDGAGFRDNEGVGNPPEFFSTRPPLARYIVGQAINCLKIGMPPHPVIVSFVDKYQAMPPVGCND